MTGVLNVIRPNDPILQEPSLQEVEGFISTNFMYLSYCRGVIIYTDKVDLFRAAKFIFTTSFMKDVGSIEINDIEFFIHDNKEMKFFGAPIRIRYYISTESSKNLIEFKLRNL